MKKLLALILAAVLALSLVACGGGSGAGDNNTPSGGNGDTTSADTPSGGGDDSTQAANSMTKEEMLETAEEINFFDMRNAYYDNKVRAKEQYCNTPIVVTGEIYTIEDNYIVLRPGDSYTDVVIDVYLPSSEIMKLDSFIQAKVIGISSDIKDYSINIGGDSWEATHFIMDNAFIETRVELTGEFFYTGTSYLFACYDVGNYFVCGSGDLGNLNFDIEEYIDKEVTITCEMKSGSAYSDIDFSLVNIDIV